MSVNFVRHTKFNKNKRINTQFPTSRTIEPKKLKSNPLESLEIQFQSSKRNPISNSKQKQKRSRSLPMALNTLEERKKRVYDSLQKIKKLPTICKSNFQQPVDLSTIQNTAPVINYKIHTEDKRLKRDDSFRASWMGLTPRQSGFRFMIEGNQITKILGDHKGDFISKRFKAFNKKLLKDQKMYKGKEIKLNEYMDWKY